MPDNLIYHLIEAYVEDRLTEAEKWQLQAIVANKESEEELLEALQEYLASLQPDTTVDKEALQHIWKNAVAIDKDARPAKLISLKKRIRVRWVAAASVILVLGIGAYWFLSNKATRPQGDQTIVAKTHDVPPPSTTRAVITLADGTKVYLDSAGNGTIAQENNINVVKNEKGEIVYKQIGDRRQEMAYNTLFNPRGSKVISLILSDGTKVWLNSESSLKYPAAFTTSTREVEITGEAYFEVKHNSKQPFKVHLPNGSIVEDIGTAFNVNAYADEAAIKTTLIEGSVIVRSESSDPAGAGLAVKLKPGQQAVLSSNFELQTTNPDLDAVMAWKNGYFQFNKASLQEVMRQISRWYDVDVSYEGKIPDRQFGGKIDRNMNASKVLEILQESQVHFRIEGKRIVVMP